MDDAGILGHLYGAAHDSRRLTIVLDALRDRTGAGSVTIHWFHRRADRLRHRWMVGCSQTPVDFADLGAMDDINPRTIAALNPVHSGVVMLEDSHIPDILSDEVAQWQRRLRRSGLGHFIGARMAMGELGEAGLAVHASHGGMALAADCRATLTAMMPHVREVLKLSVENAQREQERESMRLLIDQTRLGVLFCNPSGWIITANALGQRWMRDAALAMPERCGPGHRARLVAGARGLLLSDRPGEMRWTMLEGDWLIRAMPLMQNGFDTIPQPLGRPSHVIVGCDADSRVSPTPGELLSLFGVTRVEAELLAHLCMGEDLRAFAQSRGVSIHTARTQLKQVMAKTRTHRQSDLVRLVMNSPAGLFSSPH